MNIREACASIMGDDLARSIIADMGIEWCVIAAMSDPESDNQPAARIVIRAWNKLDKTTQLSSFQDQPANH